MTTGRLKNKSLTSVNATNTTNSSTQGYPNVELPSIPTGTSGNLQYTGEDDSVNVLTGVGQTSLSGGADQSNPPRWGYVAPSGTRIEVNDTAGSETVEIVHRSGAGIAIDSDGAVFITSQSQRGGGLNAPFGDVHISAGGDIVIRGGASLTVQTSGDMNLDVGGTFQVKCYNYNLITNNYDVTVDGPSSTSVTNDNSVVIGGIDRKSVAGDAREQVTGKKIVDVGSDYNTRVGGNNTNDVKGTSTHTIDGDHTLSSKSNTKVLSSSNLHMDTGSDFDVKTGGNTSMDSGGSHQTHVGGGYELAAGGNIGVGAGGSAVVTASDQMSVQGNDTTLLGRGAVQVGSSGPAQVIGSTTDISGSTISLKTGTLLAPDPAGSAGGPDTVNPPPMPPIPSPDGPEGPKDAKDAEVMEANDIVDTLTSARKFPEYPGNGVTESASSAGLSMISHDTAPQAEDVYNEYTSGNSGNVNPSQSGGSYDTLPEQPVDRDPNIQAVESSGSVPAYGDMSAKISKYFTIGQLINGTTTRQRPTKGEWDNIVKQGVNLAVNVLDPIKEKFPDILITSWFRRRTSNHGTGRAVDIVVQSRSMAKHAEIARFARDKLAVDQVFLEKNTSGRTHVHLRFSSGGGSPRTMTCGDPRCRSNTPGINVEWLSRRR